MILKKLETKHRIYNTSLIHGKKKTTEKNLLKSLKNLQKNLQKNSKKVFLSAIKHAAPTLKMNKQKLRKRKRKVFKEIPAFIKNKETRINLALKFIIDHSIKRTETSSFYKKLSHEVVDSLYLKSISVNTKSEIQKQILLKKKIFIQYRWGKK
jgi:ribosomal protein S7